MPPSSGFTLILNMESSLINAVMNLELTYKMVNFLTS
jgi:hypothetical protein